MRYKIFTVINSTNISNFSYNLPDEKIAKYPLKERDLSKLLVYQNNSITDTIFSNCIDYVPTNSLVIFNNTKVIHARIKLKKHTGALIEIFCLEPSEPEEYEQIFSSKNRCCWNCIIGNAKKWKDEKLEISFQISEILCTFTAVKKMQNNETYIVEFSWNTHHTFSEILDCIGLVPIPPYLHRESESSDSEQYQTVYAKHEGSVAAPTAGLHFTDSVISNLKNKNISMCNVTLHVGAGTFKPVKTENYTEHSMHHEYFSISRDVLQQIISTKFITAVGTTSVRTLESVYWLGVKLITKGDESIHELSQWDAYNLPQNISVKDAISSIIEYMDSKNKQEFNAYTQIMIIPGYTFRIVSAMFTNFHQPQSTLLLLISAFIGDNWKAIYSHALESEYRFLSFGDSSLLFGSEQILLQ